MIINRSILTSVAGADIGLSFLRDNNEVAADDDEGMIIGLASNVTSLIQEDVNDDRSSVIGSSTIVVMVATLSIWIAKQ